MTYYYQFQPTKKMINNLLESPSFSIPQGDVNPVEGDWTAPCRKKKLISFDIKRNKYLKDKGIDFLKYSETKKPK